MNIKNILQKNIIVLSAIVLMFGLTQFAYATDSAQVPCSQSVSQTGNRILDECVGSYAPSGDSPAAYVKPAPAPTVAPKTQTTTPAKVATTNSASNTSTTTTQNAPSPDSSFPGLSLFSGTTTNNTTNVSNAPASTPSATSSGLDSSNGQGASALYGSPNSFLPNTIWGWVLVVLAILIIIVMARQFR